MIEKFSKAPVGLIEKFVGYIDFNGVNGCWLWKGKLNRFGYGLFFGQQFSMLAHRLSYIWGVEMFDIHLTVDHLCKVRNCVNYNHFEIVTREENALRSGCPPAILARLVRCKNGHELAGDNLMPFDRDKRNRRNCRICHSERLKRYRVREKVKKGLPEHDQRNEKLTGWAANNVNKTHCNNGHLLEGDNLIKRIFEATGARICKPCDNERHRLLRARKKAERDPVEFKLVGPALENSLKTHCVNGHELVEPNLISYELKKGIRSCKTCANNRKRAKRASMKEQPTQVTK